MTEPQRVTIAILGLVAAVLASDAASATACDAAGHHRRACKQRASLAATAPSQAQPGEPPAPAYAARASGRPTGFR